MVNGTLKGCFVSSRVFIKGTFFHLAFSLLPKKWWVEGFLISWITILIIDFMSLEIAYGFSHPFCWRQPCFYNGSRRVIKACFHVIANYERCTSQQANKSKSDLFCYSFASASRISLKFVSVLLFTYLGAPIVKEKYKSGHFDDLMKKGRNV